MSRGGSTVSRRILVAVFVALLILATAYFLFARGRVRETSFAAVANERGEALASAFAGVGPNPQFLQALQGNRAFPKGGCAGKPSVLSRIKDALHLTVHAQDPSCSSGEGYNTDCVNHYSVAQNASCSSYCAGAPFGYVYIVSGGTDWATGWQYTGYTDLCPCGVNCAVSACTNYGGCTSSPDTCLPYNRVCTNSACAPCPDNQFIHDGACTDCQPSDCQPAICLGGDGCVPCDSDAECEAAYGLNTCDLYGTGECYYSDGEGGGSCDEEGCSCTDNGGCDSDFCDDGTCQDLDPIVVDLAGQGYELTSAQNGVKFDFFGNGKPMQMAWTAGGWNGGFLALDRNGNAKIDNGTELFGNVTPQPKPAKGRGNGFLALAVFDQPANGGNGDGIIDARDAVYSKLVVWVDKNHNGVSDPGELLTLKQAGIQSISLKYDKNSWTDMYGNKFRYRASLMRSSPIVPAQQWVYDVILKGINGAGGGH